MITCDLMSEYYKMCVAAGLNYYRLVPDISDLLNLTGWNTKTIIDMYDYYTLDIEIPRYKMDKCILLKMIMKVKYGLDWDGDQWFDERENWIPLCEFLGDD